jgi:hypothetical protein
VIHPCKIDGLPTCLGEGAGEEEVLNGLMFSLIAHHANWMILDIDVAALQHCLHVEAINQNQPSKKLDMWRTL